MKDNIQNVLIVLFYFIFPRGYWTLNQKFNRTESAFMNPFGNSDLIGLTMISCTYVKH